MSSGLSKANYRGNSERALSPSSLSKGSSLWWRKLTGFISSTFGRVALLHVNFIFHLLYLIIDSKHDPVAIAKQIGTCSSLRDCINLVSKLLGFGVNFAISISALRFCNFKFLQFTIHAHLISVNYDSILSI